MDCPNCSIEMDREDTIRLYRKRELPATEYLCDGCGFHCLWVRGIRGLSVIFDPKVDNELNLTPLGEYEEA